MAYNSPDNLASDCIFHHFVPSPPWVTLIISCPTYSCLRTFELAIPSAWKWLRWLRICLQGGKPRFDPWVRRIPWRREWLPIPVFVPGEFHGQMSMVGYSPQSGKEWVTTEANNTFPFTAWKCLQFVSSCRSTFYFPSLLSSTYRIHWASMRNLKALDSDRCVFFSSWTMEHFRNSALSFLIFWNFAGAQICHI